MKWEIKPNNCEHSGSYGKKKKNYKKALKKPTYYRQRN